MSRQYNRFVAGSSTSAIVAFLDEIGLPVSFCDISGETFLPGIRIERGRLLVDEPRLLYPGDLLHEAGHLALLSPDRRAANTGEVGDDAGDDAGFEMGAIAWSYAVALHIGIDPAIVFHSEGYRGSSQAIMENFAAGRYIGVPILKWLGLTVRSSGNGALGARSYPTYAEGVGGVSKEGRETVGPGFH
jgi:hypothetical protein